MVISSSLFSSSLLLQVSGGRKSGQASRGCVVVRLILLATTKQNETKEEEETKETKEEDVGNTMCGREMELQMLVNTCQPLELSQHVSTTCSLTKPAELLVNKDTDFVFRYI